MSCAPDSTLTPMRCSRRTMVPTSFSCGTLVMRTGAAVSSDAARIGSAAFLAPATRTSPESGTPPRMESFCMVISAPGPGGSAGGPFLGRVGLHRERMDLLAHPVPERRVHELVLAHAIQARKGRAHDHRIEMRAIPVHLEVRAVQALADGRCDRAGVDHHRLPAQRGRTLDAFSRDIGGGSVAQLVAAADEVQGEP